MQIQGGEGTQSPRALALWARAEPDWPAPLRLDESLSPPRSQCGLHLPSLWDQPVDVYRWWRRYDPRNLYTLEDRPHRPHQRRQPTRTAAHREAVLALRREFPR